MIQITPQMRVLVAVEPADFRCGIDGLAQLCRAILGSNPLDGTMFVFRSKSGKAIKPAQLVKISPGLLAETRPVAVAILRAELEERLLG